MDPRQWIIFADNGPEYYTILALCNDAPSEKKVLVTCASSGIGLATVETFARRGATVVLNYLPTNPRGVSD